MMSRALASVLARSFLAGEPELEQVVERASQMLGRRWGWVRQLGARYLESVAGKTRPRHRDVVQFILQDAGFRRAYEKHARELSVEHWLVPPQQMQPIAAAQMWGVPAIESVSALADWLWLEYGDLYWFADLKELGYRTVSSRLRHYHYRVLPKNSGSVRLIEAPKRRLKKLQREILAGILEKIPPHVAAHGFVKGRSIQTFAAPHVGRRVVLRMDLRDFFTSVGGARVQTIFRALGYPEPVADLLGGICTNAVPRDFWQGAEAGIDPGQLAESRVWYARPHLPQGAPTSPLLANVCAFRLDCRLAGLANAARAAYTRYADDLAFSGDDPFEKVAERFATSVAAVVLEEGLRMNHRKTRLMRQGVRQHLAGLVLNEHVNVMRADFDRLKATLTNCLRLGPASQNREAHTEFRSHLEGRVAFIEAINPAKAVRLRRIFDQIEW